jgi:hypothetical protein
MKTLNRTYPKYQPTLTNVGCATHGAPDCLCDVVVKTVAPIIPGPHLFHQHALDVLDDDVVSARNIYDYMVLRLGMFESFTRLVACGWCGQEMVKNHSTHTTCSSKCRMAQSRANRKGVVQ